MLTMHPTFLGMDYAFLCCHGKRDTGGMSPVANVATLEYRRVENDLTCV